MTRSCSRDSGALWWCPVSAVARLQQPSPATRARRPSMAAVSGGCDLAAVSSSRAAELRHCSITAASLQHHPRPSCGDTVPSHRPLITLYPWVRVRSWVGCRVHASVRRWHFNFSKSFYFTVKYPIGILLCNLRILECIKTKILLNVTHSSLVMQQSAGKHGHLQLVSEGLQCCSAAVAGTICNVCTGYYCHWSH